MPFQLLRKLDEKAGDWMKCIRGAQGRNRTTDTVIFSHVLYQLSYLGLNLASAREAVEVGAL